MSRPTQLTCILSSILLGCSNYFVIKIVEPSTALFLASYLFCVITCLLFAPVEAAKKPLTHKLRTRYKLISLTILGVCFLATPFLPTRVGTSITYAFVCTALLVWIAKIVQKNSP
ncbi:MAG: accessory gene regulator B family protein [Lachnospiraceae bacterium]|nr:accessory gene regulator B family protein [Lachnospiraceae bacterium]